MTDAEKRKKYGRFVRVSRVAKGWTQGYLAVKARCAQGTISSIERGISWPVLPIAARIARVLGKKLTDTPG